MRNNLEHTPMRHSEGINSYASSLGKKLQVVI
jgi:hypothetical protein